MTLKVSIHIVACNLDVTSWLGVKQCWDHALVQILVHVRRCDLHQSLVRAASSHAQACVCKQALQQVLLSCSTFLHIVLACSTLWFNNKTYRQETALEACVLQGVSLARLPSEAGSKRSQPEYPTQEDVAAAPPLKRIKPNEQPSHPFTFNFQQPGQLPVEYPSSTAAHDQPFVFTAGAQSSGGASRQSSWQNLPGHGIHAGALPPSLTPTGQSTAGSNPFMGLPSIPSGDPLGSTSALPAANVPHNVYPGFAPPAYPVGYAAPTSHMPPHAAAAYGHSLYVMPPSASLPYPYGMHPPSLHTGFPGMHPAYAYTAHAMSTQYPYPPQHSAPYQQTPSMNLQMGSENPPPPPPFPPI